MISIRLGDELEARIDELAAERGVTRTDIVRESVAAYLSMSEMRDSGSLGEGLFGSCASDRTDRSVKRKELLTDILLQKKNSR
jgi:metal-responsive CopG/Arc/MetJ family transcriptional regulator